MFLGFTLTITHNFHFSFFICIIVLGRLSVLSRQLQGVQEFILNGLLSLWSVTVGWLFAFSEIIV